MSDGPAAGDGRAGAGSQPTGPRPRSDAAARSRSDAARPRLAVARPRSAVVRPRSAVAALVAAAACGLAAGRFVLPPPPGASTSASTPPAPGSTSPPKAATGPVTTADLLGPATFGAVGITARIHVRDRFGDGVYANSACAGEKTLTQTLGGPGAHFRGLMTGTRTDPDDPTVAVDRTSQVAREVAAEALNPALAQNFAERLLLEEVPCQNEPVGHWVYGRTTTLEPAPGLSASWMGTYQGSLNTGGTAPAGREPCGGLAVLRSGSHYGVLEVDACLGTAAMSRVVRTALSQL